jgi:preprotein translocase subunit SecA
MFGIKFLRKIFGSRNQRVLKRLQSNVEKINALEASYQALSDDALQAKTAEFKSRLAKGETLDSLIPEAFAAVREASRRTLGLRHFDVQLIGGMVLHEGRIAEMHTGEGKTLVATLPAYLNALTGKSVHIVTVNDYLATRDANWMRPVFAFLGMTVGIVVPQTSNDEKRAAYAADITYGTNNEYGFDYLRDNMAFRAEERVQRDLTFAIVDEVDSILIDEARTPLIISGPAEDSSGMYQRINNVIPMLTRQETEEGPGDYFVDEKARQVFLTEDGHAHIEDILVTQGLINESSSLYDPANISLMHHINAALRAHALFQRDVDYIVRDKEIIIVDEHTGRTMQGRRWSDGLHQAIEAKEKVDIKNENQTLASITFQNYFRLYNRLSGMTGTADTEAYEFQQIYSLEVVVIPTNKPKLRDDKSDLIFLTEKEKFEAVIGDIKLCRERNQPVLVGTASIEASEYLAQLLDKEKIHHQVLNAKQHDREAQIIAEAGRPGAVTISTNMAGRGTDIVLGGKLELELEKLTNPTPQDIENCKAQWQERHDQVVAAGGLHVVGSERHESRRIDNQLRGRSGRQGDPGSTRFYLSLEDNLMRIFASPRLKSIMQKLGMEKGQAIESPMVTRAIENAQRKVEGRNFDIRKQLLEFDDVANDQRQVIYKERTELIIASDLANNVSKLREQVVYEVVCRFMPSETVEEQWDVPGLEGLLLSDFDKSFPIHQWLEGDHNLSQTDIAKRIYDELSKSYLEKEAMVSSEVLRNFERAIMLQQLDLHWKEHLANMDYLRQGIGLRGYAQKDPKQEYKREAFELFSDMLDRLKYSIVVILSKFRISTPEEAELAMEAEAAALESNLPQDIQFQHADAVSPIRLEANQEMQSEEEYAVVNDEKPIPFVRDTKKPGRNELCYCGSGKKFKHCHGRI